VLIAVIVSRYSEGTSVFIAAMTTTAPRSRYLAYLRAAAPL